MSGLPAEWFASSGRQICAGHKCPECGALLTLKNCAAPLSPGLCSSCMMKSAWEGHYEISSGAVAHYVQAEEEEQEED